MRKFVGAVFVFLALAVSNTPSMAEVGKGGNFTMLTLNIAGANADYKSPVYGVVNQAIKQIKEYRADAAALQEVCGIHLRYLREQMPDYHVYFNKQKNQPRCPNGETDSRHGNVLLVHKNHALEVEFAAQYYSEAMPDGSIATLNLACVQAIKAGKRFIACSVHVPSVMPDNVKRHIMTQEIADHMSRWEGQGTKVVVGGDFNAKPNLNAIGLMYDRFWEADQFFFCNAGCRAGRPTHHGGEGDGKIDYIFFTKNFGHGLNFQTELPAWPSDHRILVSTAPMP